MLCWQEHSIASLFRRLVSPRRAACWPLARRDELGFGLDLSRFSLGAPSSDSPSCASAALQPAHEQDCASPAPFPTHILPCSRPIRLCDRHLTDRAAAAERAEARTERIASALLACGRLCACVREAAIVSRLSCALCLESWVAPGCS